MAKVKYSIVIPAYNEEKIIEKTIIFLQGYLNKMKIPFEIIIANDGSTDKTEAIVEKLMRKYPNLHMSSTVTNKGRGAALTKSFKAAHGEYVIYIDADLAIDVSLFETMIHYLNHYDIAIGSKHIKGAQVEYPILRRAFSKVYAFLSYLLFNSKIWDFQCGFKGFKKDKALQLLPYIKNQGWSWDTEMLIKAEQAGFKIKEFPAKVNNIYERESKVNAFKDAWNMGRNLIALYFDVLSFKKTAQRLQHGKSRV